MLQESHILRFKDLKDLKNSVIFLLDIQTYNKPDLMYVGMSRSRTLLYIFETEHAEQYRKNIKN